MVHCFPFIIQFATHLSYGFNSKPHSCSIPLSFFQNKSDDCTVPYSAFFNRTHSTYLPFSVHMYLVYDFGLRFVNISVMVPSSFMSPSPSMSPCMNALGMSTVAMYLPSVTSMIQDRNSASVDTVGELVSFSLCTHAFSYYHIMALNKV